MKKTLRGFWRRAKELENPVLRLLALAGVGCLFIILWAIALVLRGIFLRPIRSSGSTSDYENYQGRWGHGWSTWDRWGSW